MTVRPPQSPPQRADMLELCARAPSARRELKRRSPPRRARRTPGRWCAWIRGARRVQALHQGAAKRVITDGAKTHQGARARATASSLGSSRTTARRMQPTPHAPAGGPGAIQSVRPKQTIASTSETAGRQHLPIAVVDDLPGVGGALRRYSFTAGHPRLSVATNRLQSSWSRATCAR